MHQGFGLQKLPVSSVGVCSVVVTRKGSVPGSETAELCLAGGTGNHTARKVQVLLLWHCAQGLTCPPRHQGQGRVSPLCPSHSYELIPSHLHVLPTAMSSV